MRLLSCLTALFATAFLSVHPVAAQEGRPVAQKDEEGYLVDFDNRPLQAVLSALAEAAGLNVILSGDIPSERTTLRMGAPVPRSQLLDVIRNLVDANNLTMTMEGSLIRIGSSQRRRGSWPTSSAPELELFTYRLKHTSAAQLAPVLMNLVSGTGGGRRNIPGGQDSRAFGNNRWGATGAGRTMDMTLLEGAVGNGANGGIARVFTEQRGENGQRMQTQVVPPDQIGQFLRNFGSFQNGDNQQGNGLSDGLSIAANEVRVVAEENTNTLLIRATAADWLLMKKIIETVDLRPLQALIEVTIVEVTRSKSLDVGVDATATHTKNGRTQKIRLPAVANARDFVAQITGGQGAIDFTVALNALASRGELRVVSLPIIIAQNNKQAMLNVGSSRPFVQVSQTVPNDPTGRVETIQYIDVGTTLTLTPTINADGYVNLVVTQTANTATNEIQFDAPVLSKREATTQVFLRDGQTTVIGGLADNTRDRVRTGIPILSSIPILGGLFRTTHDSDVQSELYLFLTPHIISTDADIDRLREAVQHESELLKKVPLQHRIPPRLADTLSTSRLPSSVDSSVSGDTLPAPDEILPRRPRRGPGRMPRSPVPVPGDSVPAPAPVRAPSGDRLDE